MTYANRKPIATLDTFRDITCAWVVASLRADDSLRVTYRSRWQGATDGRTILFRHTGLRAAIASEDKADADALIKSFIARQRDAGNNGTLLKRGQVVR
jgi:hypothetical protein